MKRIAIIGAGPMAAIFAKNAREMGIETHCFAWRQGAYAINFVDKFYPISIFEKEKILGICKRLEIDGVCCTTELTIAIASYIAKELHLPGIPYDVSMKITDKYRNRIVTQEIKNLFHPKFIKIKSEEDFRQQNFDFPCILKPINLGGKRGVYVIRNNKDIKLAFKYNKKYLGISEFIVEEFIDGRYSVESLSCNNKHYIIQITQKITSNDEHCVELGHDQPAQLSYKEREFIEETIKQALCNLGIVNGPCHTEIKVCNSKIYLIEFNARPGGDHISYPLTELSTGCSYIKEIIKVACGDFDGIDYTKFKRKFSGVRFITKQSREWQKLFDICENFDWCYEKTI